MSVWAALVAAAVIAAGPPLASVDSVSFHAATATASSASTMRQGDAATGRAKPGRQGEQPNVVIVLTDDQRDGSESTMSAVQRLLAKRGVTFTQAQSATPTCCPARASLLTGNLAPRTGVFANWASEGGWQTFHQAGWDTRTLAARLDEVGYHTALAGKYLNGYAYPGVRAGLTGDADYIPPGWDDWMSFGLPPGQVETETDREQAYYDYWTIRRTTEQSTASYLRFGDDEVDYSTDVFGRFAVDVIESAPVEDPVFLLYTPFGPHAPYTSAPRHEKAKVTTYVDVPLDDTVGKPTWVRSRPAATRQQSRQLQREQARALMAVDDNVNDIVRALARTDRLANTIFVYASDNGLAWGEFHILGSKNYPYVADVPLVMRWDAAPPGSVLASGGTQDDRLTSLTDVAATVLTAAGASTEGIVDSLDLSDPAAKRESLLVSAARNRGASGSRPMPSYCGIRTRQWLYVRYSGGFEELYRVATDPQMVVNRVGDPATADNLEGFRQQVVRECSPTPARFRWVGLTGQ